MRYFFVFSYGDPHLAHVVRGEERHTLELVRTLIRSGAQVKHLHYLSTVMEGTHLERMQAAAMHVPEGGHESPQVSSSEAEIDQWAHANVTVKVHPYAADDGTTLFAAGARVEESR